MSEFLGTPPLWIMRSKRFSKQAVVPSLDQLDEAHLPEFSVPLVAEEEVSVPAVTGNDGAGQLGDLLNLSLARCKDILELDLDVSDDNFGSILRAHVSAIQTVFNAQLRADEGRLRQRQTDMMPRILALLEGEEKKLLLLEAQGQRLQ